MQEGKQKTTQKKRLDDITRHFKQMSKNRKALTTALHCICRQERNTTAVLCVLCNEAFDYDCVDFCTGVSKLVNTNYFCTNCIYKTFIPFTIYILLSTVLTTKLD